MEKNQYDTPEEYKAAKLKKNVDKIIGNSDNLRTVQENLNLKSYDEAKEKLLGFLEPENLGTQYFVGKQEIADKLVVEMKEITWS